MLKEKIKISIIVPIYNVEQYIEKCLISILEQSYKNLEIILVNDGTKDNSMKVIKHYLSDSRIKVINKENGGLSSARNRGLEMASGDYIAFIDSDDWIEINKLIKLYEIIEEENLDIIIGNAEYYPKMEKVHKKNYFGIKNGIELLREMLEKKDYLETVWKCIYRREFLRKNNIKFIEGLLHEDTPFMFECLLKAKRVKYEDIVFYFYRQREGSIVTTRIEKNLLHTLYGLEIILENYRKSEVRYKEINMYILNIYFSISGALKKKNKKIELNILRLRYFCLKGYIKLFIIFLTSLNYKTLDLKEINLN